MIKKGALFCLKRFIMEPTPPNKGKRVVLGLQKGLGDSQVSLLAGPWYLYLPLLFSVLTGSLGFRV